MQLISPLSQPPHRRKWGQLRCRRHQMNSCCLSQSRAGREENLSKAPTPPSPTCFLCKRKRIYVQIRGRTCAYYFHSSSQNPAYQWRYTVGTLSAALWWNVHGLLIDSFIDWGLWICYDEETIGYYKDGSHREIRWQCIHWKGWR